ncbi:GFA family protein [Aliikangiella sp. IMCC44359]|uniref:GFA family protein n=1 Tax=Aliikangiella sp. IMCC44359 TaxID=3459125 RepID=UPI00403B02FE
MKRLSGQCLCGRVKFSLEENFSNFYLCHCHQCQKITGSAYASNLFTQPDNINWLCGKEFITRYDDPDRSFTKAFCTRCGSGLPFLSQSGANLIVPAGCLNEPPEIMPQNNIFCEEQSAWYKKGIEAEPVNGFPE